MLIRPPCHQTILRTKNRKTSNIFDSTYFVTVLCKKKKRNYPLHVRGIKSPIQKMFLALMTFVSYFYGHATIVAGRSTFSLAHLQLGVGMPVKKHLNLHNFLTFIFLFAANVLSLRGFVFFCGLRFFCLTTTTFLKKK